jgi:hypothetical protein
MKSIRVRKQLLCGDMLLIKSLQHYGAPSRHELARAVGLQIAIGKTPYRE